MVHSGCVVFKIHMCPAWIDSDLRYSEVPLKGKKLSTCQNIGGGFVNTGRPLQVKYWGVATPAALTPMCPVVSQCA